MSGNLKSFLRSSNVSFGSGPTCYTSTSAEAYIAYPVTPPNVSENAEVLRSLRREHFSLGASGAIDKFESSMRADYVAHSLEFHSDARKALDDKLKLQRAHFELGSDPTGAAMNYESTLKSSQNEVSNYIKANGYVKVQALKPQLNRQSIHMGSDACDYTTTANSACAVVDGSTVVADPAEARAITQGLRVSHFSLGNTPSTYESEARRSFVAHPMAGRTTAAQGGSGSTYHGSRVQLGFGDEDSSHYVSEHTREFSRVDALVRACRDARQAHSVSAKAELRASHCPIGGPMTPAQSASAFRSVSSTSYVDHGPLVQSPRDNGEKRAALRQSHFALGSTDTGDHWTSESQQAFPAPAHAAYSTGSMRPPREANHFVLGMSDDPVARTQSMEHMQMGAVPLSAFGAQTKLDKAVMHDLRRHHWGNGEGSSGTGQSESRAAYPPPPSGAGPSLMAESVRRDLRASHFAIGGGAGASSTTSREAFVNHSLVGDALSRKANADSIRDLKAALQESHWRVGGSDHHEAHPASIARTSFQAPRM